MNGRIANFLESLCQIVARLVLVVRATTLAKASISLDFLVDVPDELAIDPFPPNESSMFSRHCCPSSFPGGRPLHRQQSYTHTSSSSQSPTIDLNWTCGWRNTVGATAVLPGNWRDSNVEKTSRTH